MMKNSIINQMIGDVIKVYEGKEYFYEVVEAEWVENPRQYADASYFYMSHRNYDFGDNISLDTSDCSSWEDVKEIIEKEYNVFAILPVYMYDHSGITINTTGYSCGWDSGQIGWIWMTKEQAMEYGYKTKKEAELFLETEIATLDKYLTGDVYEIRMRSKKDPTETDTYIGYIYGWEETLAEIPKTAKEIKKSDYKDKFEVEVKIVYVDEEEE